MKRLTFGVWVLTLFFCAPTLLLTMGCGPSWKDADTKATTDAIRAQTLLTDLCDSDAGCTRDQVDAVERAVKCNLGSMIVRHGGDVDAGTCLPKGP